MCVQCKHRYTSTLQVGESVNEPAEYFKTREMNNQEIHMMDISIYVVLWKLITTYME